jgi:hypothetical protein
MIVKRKPLNLFERLYLPAIIGRVQGHLRHLFKGKKVTMAVSRGEMGRARRVIAARRIS